MIPSWIQVRLDELTESDSPITYGVVKPGDPGNVLFIRGGDLVDGRILDRQLRTITSEVSDQYKRTLLRGGELLICLVGQPGQVAVVPTELAGANIARQVGLIRLRKEVDAEFISYYLQSPEGQANLGTYTGGSVQQVINLSDLRTVNIPLPPLSEQRRIVGILDEAFNGIATAKANAEKNLQNARALFESHLQTVFSERGEGWVETTIGQQIRFIDYRGKTPEKTESGLRLITAKNVKMGYLQKSPMEFVAPESYDSWMTRGIPKRGDVLFTTEAPLANVAQLDTNEKVVFAQRIIIMQTDAAKLDSTFLKYLLLSQPVQQRIFAKGTGATVQGIKASLLKTIEISFPKTVAEQLQIVEKLDSLRDETQHLVSIYQQKLAALDALKKSLLDQAFRGEL